MFVLTGVTCMHLYRLGELTLYSLTDISNRVYCTLGEPGSILELQRDPTPSVSIVNTSLMTRFIFTYCLRITIPPISCHSNKEEGEECVRGSSASKTLYLCVQTDKDMMRWLNSISSDLDRIRNRLVVVVVVVVVVIVIVVVTGGSTCTLP